jgi:hypothetical protein
MLVDWFNLLAPDVTARLAAEYMPALSDPSGAVLLGPENSALVLASAAPRIVLVPLGGTVTKKVPQTPAIVLPSQTLYRASITQPWIWTDVQQWRAEITGVQYTAGAADSDLVQNWDYTAAMFYVLIQSLTAMCEGAWKPTRYEWVDSKPNSGKLGGFGRMISFWFELYAPVLLYNLQAPDAVAGPGLGLIPDPSVAVGSVNFASGSAGDAITVTTSTS